MALQMTLGDVPVEVVFKNIKHLHLTVHPPQGRVRISAPSRLSLGAIRAFAISKLGWIRRQRQKLRDQERETPRELLDRESHYLWGERYLLQVVERPRPPAVGLLHRRLVLTVRPRADRRTGEEVLARWYREQLREEAAKLIAWWEPILGVSVKRVFVQRMKTRWGSCNPRAGTIRFNTELAQKPKECLEYIVVHEMVHLLEPRHDGRFVALMDQFLPNWQFYRQRLNRLPVRHADWEY